MMTLAVLAVAIVAAALAFPMIPTIGTAERPAHHMIATFAPMVDADLTFPEDEITTLAHTLNCLMARAGKAREAYSRIYGRPWTSILATDGTGITDDMFGFADDLSFAWC